MMFALLLVIVEFFKIVLKRLASCFFKVESYLDLKSRV